ncbi:MAG: hypothetical protein ACYDDF_12800 [Thermoplasmatota archaeon]
MKLGKGWIIAFSILGVLLVAAAGAFWWISTPPVTHGYHSAVAAKTLSANGAVDRALILAGFPQAMADVNANRTLVIYAVPNGTLPAAPANLSNNATPNATLNASTYLPSATDMQAVAPKVSLLSAKETIQQLVTKTVALASGQAPQIMVLQESGGKSSLFWVVPTPDAIAFASGQMTLATFMTHVKETQF